MNLFSAPDAVFALPIETVKQRKPRLMRGLVAREHVQDGEAVVLVMLSGADGYFRLTPQDWQVLQLFDGQRSNDEIATIYSAESGNPCTAEDVGVLADVYGDTELFYKSPEEKSQALLQELRRNRGQRRRKLDLSYLILGTWPTDAYFKWLEPRLQFVYTKWFTLWTLCWFGFMAWIFWSHFGQLWSDSLRFYHFTDRGVLDLVAVWASFAFVTYFHETAHGLTAKHWGASSVPRMGFVIFYLAPSFFCDCSEAWVQGNKWQRISVAFAGLWVELMICSAATVVWWGTAPGMAVHEFAYKVILASGLLLIVANLNPLIKLDGYYIFCDLIGIPDLKERSTSYVSQWIRRTFGLPAEVPSVRARRKWFFIAYALLSGVYSYGLLLIIAHWAYNIAYTYTPEWAFVPAILAAIWIFHTPLQRLRTFMKTVYLDKKQRWQAWLRTRWGLCAVATTGLLALVLVFAPVWRETVDGRFVLEAPRRATIRAEVSGVLSQINVDEGDRVAAGARIAVLRNLSLESRAAESAAAYQTAAARASEAQLRYADFGAAQQERARAAEVNRQEQEQVAKLQLFSPIAGVVVTPRVHDLVGSYLPSGATVVEVQDLSTMRARLFVAEAFMDRLQPGAAVAGHVDGTLGVVRGYVQQITPASAAEAATTVFGKSEYEGTQAPNFYAVLVSFPNPGGFREGMTGVAKILVGRRSVAGFCWEWARNFLGRRLW